MEIFGGSSVCVIDNYKSLFFTGRNQRRKMSKFNKDSGHRAEFAVFFSAIQNDQEVPVTFKEYLYTTLTTLCIEKSLADHTLVNIDLQRDLGYSE